MKKFDVIIIGGGHNGLVAACVLSKKGNKVLVIEKNEKLGGLANYSEYLSNISQEVLKELNITVEKNTSDNFVSALSEDLNHTVLQINGSKNVQFLQTSASDSDQKSFINLINKYDLFARTLRSFMFKKPPRVKSGSRSDIWQLFTMGFKVRLLGKKNMRELLRVIGLNIADDLEDNIESDCLKGLISNEAVIGTNLGARSPGSILNLLYNQATNNSLFRINKFNTNSFLKSIEDICKKNNVEIQTDKKVEKINISNQSVNSVLLNTGEQIETSAIISNSDPKTTYLELVGASNLDTDFIRRTNNYRTRGTVAKVNIEFKNDIKIKNLESKYLSGKFVYAPNIKYIEHAFNANKYNKLTSNPCLEFYINKNKISANVYFIPYLKKSSHDKEQILKNVKLILDKFIEENQILSSLIETPNDIESKYNISGGHWSHGDMEIDQLLMMRPFYGSSQYSTPINGLYLCSAGTHPGGGITGINGVNAAKQLLKDKGNG